MIEIEIVTQVIAELCNIDTAASCRYKAGTRVYLKPIYIRVPILEAASLNII
jgi:hypothetical protein